MSPASNIAASVNNVFIMIVGIGFVFLIGITAAMIYFAVKYRRSKAKTVSNIHGNAWLEIIWTVIPTLIVMGMFYYGYMGYTLMKTIPEGAMEVKVTGRMWSWSFEYPNGAVTDRLVLPINKPAKMVITSVDVLHSFYIPAFRIKEDAVPGKMTYMGFVPTKEGEYDIQCAEYCGLRHSYMLSKVKVVSDDDYQKWLASQAVAGSSMEKLSGETVMGQKGCVACHSRDGSKLVGPSFKGRYGTTIKVKTNGELRDIVMDDAYIRQSIANPTSDVADGFSPLMPSQSLNEAEVQAIIEMVKSIQ